MLSIFKSDKTLTKTYDASSLVTLKASSSYDRIYEGTFKPLDIKSLETFHAILKRIQHRSDHALVNAVPKTLQTFTGCRLTHDQDDGRKATLIQLPSHIACIDIDDVDIPAELDCTDRCQEIPEYLIENYLPDFCKDVSYVYQFSNSAGLETFGKVHLWFMFTNAYTFSQFKQLFKGCPIDEATFRPAQVLYTANPRFDGISDFMTSVERIGIVHKKHERVPAVEVNQPAPVEPTLNKWASKEIDLKLLKMLGTTEQKARADRQLHELELEKDDMRTLVTHVINRHAGSMHHTELLGMKSTMHRAGLADYEIKNNLDLLKDPSSASGWNNLQSTSKGNKWGIPKLEEYAGKKLRDIKQERLSRRFKEEADITSASLY